MKTTLQAFKLIGAMVLSVLLAPGFADTFIVTITEDAGPGSFRQCLLDANTHIGADTIIFNIPTTDSKYDAVGGSWKIEPLSALPGLTDDSTTLDGTIQAVYSGGDPNPLGPEIELAGTNAGEADGIHVLSAYNVIKGLVINRFKYFGVHITYEAAHHNTVSGCYIGVDIAGAMALGNGFSGVILYNGAKKNVIGGRTPAERNVISGNGWSGVEIQAWQADSNLVIGNYIGTDATGSRDIGNFYYGVSIWSGAAGNIIGGMTSEERNIISANDRNGIEIVGPDTDHNLVMGNYIGTDRDGIAALPNQGTGIAITTNGNIIGGTTPGAGNVIAFNFDSGIVLYHAMDNVIAGNFIGTNSAGVVLSGNKYCGIYLGSGSRHNTIGPANFIVNNDSDGIRVEFDSTVANRITQNPLFHNGRLGIQNLDGGNTELSPPIITLVTPTSISGMAFPNSTVEVFSDSADEGKIYEGTVTSDAAGNFTWIGTPTGPHITATVTNTAGNSSEFSQPYLTKIENEQSLPALTTFKLEQNYPNPFNPGTQINYVLSEAAKVKLTVFNIIGQEICTLIDQVQPVGEHTVWWDGLDDRGRKVSAGIYIYQIKADVFLESRKMIMVK